jgi:Holliday junction resolvase RusA-like endonuclease
MSTRIVLKNIIDRTTLTAQEFKNLQAGIQTPKKKVKSKIEPLKCEIDNQVITIPIKPLSVNEAWKGKRVKSIKYAKYQQVLLLVLPNMQLPPPPYELHIEFGFSNVASDIDNPIKSFLDVLQKKYGFDDKNVSKMVVEKMIVKKENEYIKFKILHHTKSDKK